MEETFSGIRTIDSTTIVVIFFPMILFQPWHCRPLVYNVRVFRIAAAVMTFDRFN